MFVHMHNFFTIILADPIYKEFLSQQKKIYLNKNLD